MKKCVPDSLVTINGIYLGLLSVLKEGLDKIHWVTIVLAFTQQGSGTPGSRPRLPSLVPAAACLVRASTNIGSSIYAGLTGLLVPTFEIKLNTFPKKGAGRFEIGICYN